LDWNKRSEDEGEMTENSECYDLPFITKYSRRWAWTSYFPISPTYNECSCRKRKTSKEYDVAQEANDAV
jgi:nucleobase transporter 1/2